MNPTLLPDWAYDFCWLDCARPGLHFVHNGREICLCQRHRLVLAEGCWAGNYDGAPLPRDTKASEWPWRDVPQAA